MLEDKYTVKIVDMYINLITVNIPTALDYLFYNYRKVSLEEVAQKELEVILIIQLPSDPIILLIRLLEQLKKLLVHEEVPYTNIQILEKVLSIIKATCDLKYELSKWKEKPNSKKNWANLKTHFYEDQLQLKKIKGPLM